MTGRRKERQERERDRGGVTSERGGGSESKSDIQVERGRERGERMRDKVESKSEKGRESMRERDKESGEQERKGETK